MKPNIHSKLLEFQKVGISIKKDKKNPHFKNNYADINEILDKVKPVLNQLSVVLIQKPDEAGLITILHDTESDTEIVGRLNFVGATDPQKLGSNITYYRRYALIAMLGLEDDDDDGNKASHAAPAQKPKITLDQAFGALRKATTVPELEAVYRTFPADIRHDSEVINVATEVKEEIINNSIPVTS